MSRLVAAETLKLVTTRLLLWLGLLLLGLEVLVIALHISQDSLDSLAEARNQRDVVSIAAVSPGSGSAPAGAWCFAAPGNTSRTARPTTASSARLAREVNGGVRCVKIMVSLSSRRRK